MSLPIGLEDTQVSVPAKLKSNSSCRRQLLLQDLVKKDLSSLKFSLRDSIKLLKKKLYNTLDFCMF